MKYTVEQIADIVARFARKCVEVKAKTTHDVHFDYFSFTKTICIWVVKGGWEEGKEYNRIIISFDLKNADEKIAKAEKELDELLHGERK